MENVPSLRGKIQIFLYFVHSRQEGPNHIFGLESELIKKIFDTNYEKRIAPRNLWKIFKYSISRLFNCVSLKV